MDLCFLWLSKDQWEFIYYVAVILLTAIIVFITTKTYISQVRKKPELLCRCIEASPDESKINIFLEIHNYSNYLSRNIKVQIQDKDFGVIPFLIPGESVFYFVGHKTSFADKVTSIGLDLTSNLLKVVLDINNDKEETYKINIESLATSAIYSKKAASLNDYMNAFIRNSLKKR